MTRWVSLTVLGATSAANGSGIQTPQIISGRIYNMCVCHRWQRDRDDFGLRVSCLRFNAQNRCTTCVLITGSTHLGQNGRGWTFHKTTIPCRLRELWHICNASAEVNDESLGSMLWWLLFGGWKNFNCIITQWSRRIIHIIPKLINRDPEPGGTHTAAVLKQRNEKTRWNFSEKIMIFWIVYAQETHIFCTMTNASRQHGSVAAAIKTPWRNRIEKPIKIDVPKISCQPQAGHLKATARSDCL